MSFAQTLEKVAELLSELTSNPENFEKIERTSLMFPRDFGLALVKIRSSAYIRLDMEVASFT